MIHVDTSFLIRALTKGSSEDRQLRNWLRDGESLGISAISWTEFLCGPVGEEEVELATDILREEVPFLPQDSIVAARLFNLNGRRQGSLTDCMIAATAIRCDAALATSDVADFRELASLGLKMVGT